MRRLTSGLIAIAVVLLASGCANQKDPAEKAVAEVESAVAAIRDEAAKFAPEALRGLDGALTLVKDKLAKADYKGVLADAPQLTTALATLKETVATKKAEAASAMAAATEQWNSLSADVPKMVDAIQSRVDTLSKSRKLPKNLTQESFDAARSGFESMKETWSQASSAYANGDAVNAVALANTVKQKGNEVLQLLGMTS